jgi:hypothetical protein
MLDGGRGKHSVAGYGGLRIAGNYESGIRVFIDGIEDLFPIWPHHFFVFGIIGRGRVMCKSVNWETSGTHFAQTG